MAELIDYFKTDTGRIIPFTLISDIGEIIGVSKYVARHQYWFRIYTELGETTHRDAYHRKYYIARYHTEFEARVVKAALEGRWRQYKRFYRYE